VTKAAEAVLADALRLDLDARAGVACELLASLDGPADPDADAAWAAGDFGLGGEFFDVVTVSLSLIDMIRPAIDSRPRDPTDLLTRCGGCGTRLRAPA
jgi:hypothetical protein